MDWKVETGKILKRLLQILSHDEEVWVFASRLQKQNDFSLARPLLLEGLRFHPKSLMLYREYFMLELEFYQKVQNDPELLNDVEAKEEVQNGKIIETVFLQAIENCCQKLFTAELLGLAKPFHKLFKLLKEALVDHHGDDQDTWLVLANLELHPSFMKDRSATQKVDDAVGVMIRGLEKIPDAEHLDKCLNMLGEISESNPELIDDCAKNVVKVLLEGQKLGILDDQKTALLKEYTQK